MTTIRIKRGHSDPEPLQPGELAVNLDTGDVFVGIDGITNIPLVGTSYTNTNAQDAVGTILLDSSTVDFAYDTLTPAITADVKDGAITLAKMANLTANTLIGNNTGIDDVPMALTTTQVKTLLSINNLDNTSDINKPVSTAQALADAATLTSAEAYADSLVYTNEMAQDAVGGILTNSSTVNLTYNDGLNTITADVVASGISHTNLADIGTNSHSAIDTFIASKGGASGLAPLGSDSKIPTSYLPALAITDTFVIVSQVAMLALTAQTGDIAVRTDLNKTFILKGTDPTVLADWQELLTPTDTVLSVNGFTGAVTLTTSDIAEGTRLYYTDAKVIAAPITGFTSGAGSLGATDTILQAFQKLDGNVGAKLTSSLANAKIFVGNVGGTATAATMSGDATLDNAGAITVTKINGKSVSLAGNLTTSGAFAVTFTLTNTTSVTLPTSGTLATTADLPAGANPGSSAGLNAVNGLAATFMRSDGAPAISQTIAPTWTGLHTHSLAVDATSTDGVALSTSQTASSGNQKWSPRLRLTGQGWKTTSVAASQPVDWIAEVRPVQGSGAPSSQLVISSQINGGGYTPMMFFDTNSGVTFGSSNNSGTVNVWMANLRLGTGDILSVGKVTGSDTFATTASMAAGTTTAAASAILTLSSTTKGFLPPKMTTTQRDSISAPTEGLQIHNTTTHKINFYNGSAWEVVVSA